MTAPRWFDDETTAFLGERARVRRLERRPAPATGASADKHMLIVLGHDLARFTQWSETDGPSDAGIEFHIPPDLDGWYLIDARAEVATVTDDGFLEFTLFVFGDLGAYGLLNDGTDDFAYLIIASDDRWSPTAASEGTVTTYQFAENDRVFVRLTDAPASPHAARGPKVWLKFGKSPAAGALDPVPD